MADDYREISKNSIYDANEINNRLIEKTLAMRCSSYLSQIKAELLTDTIFEIDSSKKVLSTMNNKLQQEIDDRKKAEKALLEAKNQVEEATLLKDKFVAIVTHDLKNPLTVIDGYLQLLQMLEDLPEEGSMYVKSALAASEHMQELITSVLNISKINSGAFKPDIQKVDLQEAIGAVCESMNSVATNKSITLNNSIPVGIFIDTDPYLFREVITNVLSNAIKFSVRGSVVTIHSPLDDSNDILISDNGTGIDANKIKNLFSYHSKTSSKGTEGESGTGLGLPLSRDIMKTLGGDLVISSTGNTGTTFRIIHKQVNPPT